MRAVIDAPADLGEVLLHGLGIAIGQNQARALSLPRADGPEDVGPICGRLPLASVFCRYF